MQYTSALLLVTATTRLLAPVLYMICHSSSQYQHRTLALYAILQLYYQCDRTSLHSYPYALFHNTSIYIKILLGAPPGGPPRGPPPLGAPPSGNGHVQFIEVRCNSVSGNCMFSAAISTVLLHAIVSP
jgi:hypothetical protein